MTTHEYLALDELSEATTRDQLLSEIQAQRTRIRHLEVMLYRGEHADNVKLLYRIQDLRDLLRSYGEIVG